MNRRRIVWMLAMFGLTALVVASAPAFPLDQDPAEAEAGAQETTEDRSQTVENILREQERLLTGQRFAYDPAGRRDPFRPLFEAAPIEAAKRPRGVAGMLVAELKLSGIVQDPVAGDIAMITGSDNRGYFLRHGDSVFDGTLISIDSRRGTVTFRQQVDDPRLIKPYRDVVKRLQPLEESADE